MITTGWPVLLSASRKDFVGESLGAGLEIADDRIMTDLGAERAQHGAHAAGAAQPFLATVGAQ